MLYSESLASVEVTSATTVWPVVVQNLLTELLLGKTKLKKYSTVKISLAAGHGESYPFPSSYERSEQ